MTHPKGIADAPLGGIEADAASALDGEFADRAELADPRLYIGGEVCLEFESQSVFVSWSSGDGWEDHFSIGVRTESLFVPHATL